MQLVEVNDQTSAQPAKKRNQEKELKKQVKTCPLNYYQHLKFAILEFF
jgi:hypothetical protein